MKTIQIGSTNLTTSAVALGVMRIADKTSEEAQKIVETAIASGINFFDTADIYGSGQSSIVFGQALKDAGVKRDKIFIQSKAGIILPNGQINGDGETGPRFDFSYDHLIASVDIELERLQTDYLDTFLLHRPDTLVDINELARAFTDLKTAGKVHHFGVSNMNPYQIALIQNALGEEKLQIDQLQFGIMHTNMIDSELHVNMNDAASVDHDGGILSYTRLHNLTIQAWSPFQFGFFEGVFIDNEKFPELNQTLKKLASKYDVSKSAIAVAWILHHPANMQVIIGSMTPSRIIDMTKLDFQLTNQEWYDVYMAAGNTLP